MSKIILDTDIEGAPGCIGQILQPYTGETCLVQSDWDWPGVASVFGWSVRFRQRGRYCDHSGTDGTVDCPGCGMTAAAFIESAGDWLRDHDGATAPDPGYFNQGGAQ